MSGRTSERLEAMTKKWVVRPYCAGDMEGIFALFSHDRVESSFRTEDWWNWRYRDNPAGEAITWVAEADGKIVSHLSSTPLRAQILGEEGIILRGGDGRTIPEYRKRGIFSKLMLNTIQQGAEKGWSLFLSLPSQQLYPTLIKLGWLDVNKIPKFVKILQPKTVAAVIRRQRGWAAGFLCLLWGTYLLKRSRGRNRSGQLDSQSLSEDKDFDVAYDGFWVHMAQNVKNAVIRDSGYLNWRYRDNPLYASSPNHSYIAFSVRDGNKILGVTVLGCYKEKYRVGRIMEFLVMPEHQYVADILLSKATEFFHRQRMDVIMTLAQNLFLSKGLCKHHGYFADNTRKTNFAIKPMALTMVPDALINESDWLVTWGESGIL